MKLCSDLLAEREANVSLRKENAQLEGKAAFYDLFIDLKHSTNLRTTAKELDVPERRFVWFLLEKPFVQRTASGNVLPYANVKNAGLFCVEDYCSHGHDYMALERFAEDTRHMIIFDVLTNDSPVGGGERILLFLSVRAVKKICGCPATAPALHSSPG